MRVVLLVAVLWLLFDVVLVAALITARHVYSAFRRLRSARPASRPARSGHP
jgi:hypothetical protein